VHSENRGLSDLNGREIALMLPIVAMCIWIGVQPNAFLDRADGSLRDVSARIERARSVRTASVEEIPTHRLEIETR
jgi:NADH-quinone oxidoreductase subunit M